MLSSIFLQTSSAHG